LAAGGLLVGWHMRRRSARSSQPVQGSSDLRGNMASRNPGRIPGGC
jgi:hypothetical protein